MSLISQEATFRCRIADHGVNLTKADWPQWTAQLRAVEIYDVDEREWVDWSDVDENQITAYMVLIGSKGETLNVQQIMKATGWDGTSIQELGELDLSEVTVQARIELQSYNGKESYQVAWMDATDAEPGRSVKKLSADELKQVDAKFKSLLSARKQVKPAKAPAKAKPATPPQAGVIQDKRGKKTPTPLPCSPPKDTETFLSPLPHAPPQISDLPGGKCTKQEAWDTCVDLQDPKTDANDLAKAWLTAITEVTGKNSQHGVAEEQWFLIKEAVLDAVGRF